jgi:CBS domain containing-hemolysin-like protein
MVERVLELSGRKVADEMVPWRNVITVGVGDAPAVLWRLADQTSYSRFPVVDAHGAAVGVLQLRNALVHTPGSCPSIRELMTPVHRLDGDTPLREALSIMQNRRLAMAIVTRQNTPIGVVTVKDLIEPITGELASW